MLIKIMHCVWWCLLKCVFCTCYAEELFYIEHFIANGNSTGCNRNVLLKLKKEKKFFEYGLPKCTFRMHFQLFD